MLSFWNYEYARYSEEVITDDFTELVTAIRWLYSIRIFSIEVSNTSRLVDSNR